MAIFGNCKLCTYTHDKDFLRDGVCPLCRDTLAGLKRLSLTPEGRGRLLEAASQPCDTGPSHRAFEFVLPGRSPCRECHGACVVCLSLGVDGYSVGTGFRHAADCPMIRCPHNVPWKLDCAQCEAEAEADWGEPEDE